MKKQNRASVPPGCDIWDRYFKVKMLYLHSRSIDQIRKFGIRISGIEEIDRDLERQMIETEMNIDSMFEKWRKGVTIRVINYNDSGEIYRIIHSHLVAWAEYLSTGVNIGDAPLKDLIELDQFAAIVYDKAVNVFSQEDRNTAIASNFLNVQSINFKNILKREPNESSTKMNSNGVEVMTVTKNEKASLPMRHSMKDIFNEQINRVSKWSGGSDGV